MDKSDIFFLLVTIVFIGILGVICVSVYSYEMEQDYVGETAVQRVIDYDAQVVCWISARKSISCLPISETSLSREQ